MDVMKIQKFKEMAESLRKHNIVIDTDDAISIAENIYGKENNFSKEEMKMDNDADEMRKDIRKISFALRDAINEINTLKTEHSKLQREFNDIIVGQKPRPQVSIAPNPQFAYTPAPQKAPQTTYTAQQQVGPQAVVGAQQQQSIKPQMASSAQERLLEQLNASNETKSLRDPAKPIDRNNIAPEEVKLENFFNFGRK
ncbi:MAG: hypothetical protein ABIJ34_03270 [archaeon]